MRSDRLVIIGAGVNGLVAAAYLAKRGLMPLVLERSDRVGGCARSGEIAPGFRCPRFAHSGALDAGVIRDLRLESHGLEMLTSAAHLFAPSADGRPLVLWSDVDRAARSIAGFSARDAARYPEFLASFARIAAVVRAVSASTPPDIDRTSVPDLLSALGTARQFRALGRRDGYRLLRWMPMPVADLVGEWFESEPLRAAIAAGGILGSFLGPRSAGTGAILLQLGATTGHPVAHGAFARGGPQAIADALAAAARGGGAEIRTGVEVVEIQVNDRGAADAVLLSTGERISASAVVSGVDVKRTMLTLVDPARLAPAVLQRVGHVRAHGTLAKVNFAVSALPRFAALSDLDVSAQAAALSGLTRLAPELDAIERAFDAAKYGAFADEPWIELTVPSTLDPSLAPAGQHVVSAYVQYAPYRLRNATWDEARDRLGAAAAATIDRYAPGFIQSIVAREVITPLDLEREIGLTGGHIFHGELSLDQWFVARPLLGWSRGRTPIRHLYLCGSSTHPGTGLNGLSGRLAAGAIEVRR